MKEHAKTIVQLQAFKNPFFVRSIPFEGATVKAGVDLINFNHV